jgi:hypothetical protein
LALTIPRLAKLGSNFGSNKRTRSRPDKRTEMDFALFYFGGRGKDEKQDIPTKTGTPINYLSVPRNRLYVSIDLNPLTEVGRAVESKVSQARRISRLRAKRVKSQKTIPKLIKGTKSFSKSTSNIGLVISFIYRQIQITLKLHTERKIKTENPTRKVFHREIKGYKVLMSPELVNSVRSHIGTKLRTFV